MTYTPTIWVDGDCVMAADMNQIEHGVDIAQGDVIVLRGLTGARPASDPELIGRLYFATDAPYEISRDNGGGWDVVGYAGPLWERYISTPQGVSYGFAADALAIARCYLVPMEIPWPMVIDRIGFVTWTPNTGNYRVAIYEEGGVDTPAGGTLVIEAGPIATGGAYRLNLVNIPDTALAAGQYYASVQINTVTDRLACWGENSFQIYCYYDLGAFGAFINPCPAVTWYSRGPKLVFRVKENLAV